MSTSRVDLTGDYRSNIYAAARRLLAEGADPAARIETWRAGKLSMSGNIGECAKLTVRQNNHGKPSLQLSPWVPFSSDTVRAPAAETPWPGMVADAGASMPP